jgi:hypothetical protein
MGFRDAADAHTKPLSRLDKRAESRDSGKGGRVRTDHEDRDWLRRSAMTIAAFGPSEGSSLARDARIVLMLLDDIDELLRKLEEKMAS